MNFPGDCSTETVVTRKRVFTVSLVGMEEFLFNLRKDRFTGKITVNMSQGGMNSVIVEDCERLPVEGR